MNRKAATEVFRQGVKDVPRIPSTERFHQCYSCWLSLSLGEFPGFLPFKLKLWAVIADDAAQLSC